MTIPRVLFETAHAALAAGTPAAAEAAPLLALLGWQAPMPDPLRLDRMRLLGAAQRCTRVFRLAAPHAPGLDVFGAELDLAAIAGEPGLPVVGASGVGADAGTAFAACLAEAAELAAQVETPADRTQRGPSLPDTLTLHRWPDAAPRALPVDRVLRRAPGRVRVPASVPLSVGCAAGRTGAEARIHAVLELIERDAVALWWQGGRPPRPIALEAAARAAALSLRLRQQADGRRTWLLDITSDLDVPCAAAISLGPDGIGFCCGTASRATLSEAACAALLELCQNELGVAVARAKAAERGESALNARDRAILQRHATVRADGRWLLEPVGAPRDCAMAGDSAETLFAALGRRLCAAGIEVLLYDHTRPAGLPVWRVVCEGLACEPSSQPTARLDAAIGATGGGPGIRHGLTIHGLVPT